MEDRRGHARLEREASTDPQVLSLSRALTDEIFNALGLSRRGLARRAFGGLFSKATARMAEIGVAFDRRCREQGLPRASAWALTNWCTGIQSRGTESIPPDGPLLVVSNHPGTYDALVIASELGRPDLRIIVSDIPFLKRLPHACGLFFFVDEEVGGRAVAARAALRHLQAGGALLLYGTGLLDPDPALFTDAALTFDRWSRSIELFVRRVPQAHVVPCVVSHAVAARWAQSPLTWLRRDPLDKRRLAEFGQVIQQLFWPGRLYLSPRVSFGVPMEAAALLDGKAGEVMDGLVHRQRALLEDHWMAFGRPAGTGPYSLLPATRSDPTSRS